MSLVVNMDAPKNCSGCCLMGSPKCPYDGSKVKGSNYPNCPIVGELPSVHGRLIDADQMIEICKHWVGTKENQALCDVIVKILEEAPTILEASTEGEESR